MAKIGVSGSGHAWGCWGEAIQRDSLVFGDETEAREGGAEMWLMGLGLLWAKAAPGAEDARRGRTQGAEAGPVPAPGRVGAGPGLLFSRLVAVRIAEAWGSRAARRPRRGGRVEPAAAALGRETHRRGGRTSGSAARALPLGIPRRTSSADGQTDTAPCPSAHLLPGRRPTVDAAASRGQEPEPAPGGGVEGVGARGVALKLFVQLLGCSRSGGAVVRAGAAEPSGTGRSASSGREEPQSEEGEEEEEKEEERGPRWRLGSRKPGSWTGDAAVCTDSAPAARAPQALARASAPGGRGARLGADESGPPRSPSRRGSASRAGPGRASETMNFLLSWVHWSLALLLYLHHAKWSQAAPMAEGEQKPHEVVKFMDVYQRSYCRPIETLVDIFQEYPDEIEYIFKPSCVPLMRCGGCCNDEGLECVPTEEFNITMQIMRIKPHQGQHIGEMSFLQHNKCECRKSVRGKGKGQKRKRKKSRYKSWSAYVVPPLSRFPEPPQPPIKLPPAGPWNPASLLLPFPGSRPPSSLVSLSHSHSTNWHRWVDVVVALLVQGWGPCGPCSERRKHLFVQDPQTCKCSCKNTDSRCKARQLELNEHVTSQGGEPGGRKEPPSGFRERDVSPGKTDTE
eukprot:bmy_00037T0